MNETKSINSIDSLIAQLETVILSKPTSVRLAVACLIANGHLLIEDLPGMGKTTLASAIAKLFDLSFNRIQFTSDMLPSDVTGSNIYNPQAQNFKFHKGPVFCQLLLADELNRATPKAQSALLQAMEEHEVSIDGHTYQLDQPFFVIATQNPTEQSGTYLLPESQLDRFSIKISLGYPDENAERKMLMGFGGRNNIDQLKAVIDHQLLSSIQQLVKKVDLSDAVLDYAQALIKKTRDSDLCEVGLSPRGAMALIQMSKAWAYMHKRDFVVPKDISSVFKAVCSHRLVLAHKQNMDALLDQILNSVSAN
ncbi:MAG: MoxR family ATPase [Saccharospirillaceae bacterium]|nr:MoxR family ATPase [Pseudomonadales bacterium]NRB81626.1 MoxR family ATPase [Saccharospirillaceae bacterium]